LKKEAIKKMINEQVLLIGVMILATVFLFSGTVGYPSRGGLMMGPWFIFPIIGLIFIYMLIRMMRGGGHGSGMCGMEDTHAEEKSPLDTLKERYAKGEITKEEYLDMRKEISEEK
jgi:putative membrane protein